MKRIQAYAIDAHNLRGWANTSQGERSVHFDESAPEVGSEGERSDVQHQVSNLWIMIKMSNHALSKLKSWRTLSAVRIFQCVGKKLKWHGVSGATIMCSKFDR